MKRRSLTAGGVVLAALLLGACQGRDSSSTSLTLVAKNSFVGTATFRLECDPPGGDIPQAARACARLAQSPSALLRPEPFTCFGGTFSWWDITITGRYAGDPVNVRTSMCWTPQMELIRFLGIARELDRHVDPLSRPAYLGSGIPRSELAERVEIPEGTPGWLVRIARLQARRLGDERPERMAIELGAPHRITLERDLVCEQCSRPPNASAPRGSVAHITVDPKTRIVESFSLRR